MGGGGKKEKTETKQKVIYYRGSKCDIRTRNIPEINKQVMSSHTHLGMCRMSWAELSPQPFQTYNEHEPAGNRYADAGEKNETLSRYVTRCLKEIFDKCSFICHTLTLTSYLCKTQAGSFSVGHAWETVAVTRLLAVQSARTPSWMCHWPVKADFSEMVSHPFPASG